MPDPKRTVRKEMLINMLQPEECRIAIVENGLLEELYVERMSQESYVGNIYKGKVVNIEPSIQAAFVDFGVGRNGFLHVSDVDPQYYKNRRPGQGDGLFDLLELPEPPEDEADWEAQEQETEDEPEAPHAEMDAAEEPYTADEPESANGFEGEFAPPPREEGGYRPRGSGPRRGRGRGGRQRDERGRDDRHRTPASRAEFSPPADAYAGPEGYAPPEGYADDAEFGPRADASPSATDYSDDAFGPTLTEPEPGNSLDGPPPRPRFEGGRDQRGPRDDSRGGRNRRGRGGRGRGRSDDRRDAPRGPSSFAPPPEAAPPFDDAYRAEGELPPEISWTDEGEAPVVRALPPDLGASDEWEPTPQRPRPNRRPRAETMPAAEERTVRPRDLEPQEPFNPPPPAVVVIEQPKPDFSGFGASIFGDEAPPVAPEPPRAESRRPEAEIPAIDIAPPAPSLRPEPARDEHRSAGFGSSVFGGAVFAEEAPAEPEQPRRPQRHEPRREEPRREEPRREEPRRQETRRHEPRRRHEAPREEAPRVEQVQAERLAEDFGPESGFSDPAYAQEPAFAQEPSFGHEQGWQEQSDFPPAEDESPASEALPDSFGPEFGDAPQGEDEYGPRDGAAPQGDYYAPERPPGADRGRPRHRQGGDRQGGGDRRGGPRGDQRGGDRRGGPRGDQRGGGGRGFRGGPPRGPGGARPAVHQKPPIQEIFRRGQEVLVQVIKEGLGTKGPTLSTYISIPGRYLVLMPGLHRIGVSRKIEDDNQRRRLRQILQDLQPPPGLGFIIRTAGLDRTKRELLRDLHYLTRLWRVIVRRLKRVKGPDLIYEESDIITRTIRDVFTAEIAAIRVDEPKAFEHAQEFMNFVMPRFADRLSLDAGAEPLFHRFGLEREIAKIQQKRVPLPGGGSLVIEQTEALVAIDVNSGNTRVQDDAEETAFRVNLAAAKEVARQLRLRDLGGVIIIDFIDMRDERKRRQLEDTLSEAIRRDRARTKTLRMSQFGIVQMTRQRIRPSLKRSHFQDCPSCLGTGQVKTAESMSIEVMRLLELASCRTGISRIHVRVAEPVAQHLLNRKRREVAALEGKNNQQVTIFGSAHLPPEALEITTYDATGAEVRLLPQEPAASLPARRPGRYDRPRSE